MKPGTPTRPPRLRHIIRDLSRLWTELSAWLHASPDAPMPDAVAELGEAADDRWALFCSLCPRLLKPATVRRLIARTHLLLGRSPRSAVAVGRLAVRVIEEIPVTGERIIRLGGDTWREHAAAFLSAADYTEARDAAQLSRFYYSMLEKPTIGITILGLIEGQILHHLGQSDEGLRMIERSANELKSIWDRPEKYAEARTIYAHTLLSLGRPAEALAVYESVAVVAEQLGATETLAHILNNVGVCAVSLGDLSRAESCFALSYKMLEDLGLTAELPRVRGGKVLVLTARGRYNEAVSVLYEIRRQFLDFGMPVVAALVSLDIVENLYLARRTSQIPSLCEEMIETFTAASLRQNAMKALGYLSDLAQQRPVLPKDVQFVRSFFSRLDAEPEAVFELPN